MAASAVYHRYATVRGRSGSAGRRVPVVGWRLALADQDAVPGIITQNGNGYEAGFVESSAAGTIRHFLERTLS
jgi:hypothetical protein